MLNYTVVCTINKSEPAYQPNVYLCRTGSYCCFAEGEAACCLSNITLESVFHQTYPIVLVFLGFMFVALLVRFYFTDDEPRAEIDNESSKKNSVMAVLYPTAEDDHVDDPLFGKVFEERVARRAYVSRQFETAETLRRRKSTYTIED
ncbi:hypothetical protein RB195_000055 [Necator americanus]|uniref:CX domain-containing protein n=1 Tax=Necator americanus TaxID=51031 RepID=A0ABR1D8D7_NECAM